MCNDGIFHGLFHFLSIDPLPQFLDVQSFVEVEIAQLECLGNLLFLGVDVEDVALAGC